MKKDVYGIIVIDKPKGITSHTVAAKVKRMFGGAKTGHTGTLDPMATGVLPIMVGRAVKAMSYMVEGDKHYIAELTLGVESDTEDSTGTLTPTNAPLPTEEHVRAVAQSMLGESMQIPPMYSAIQVGGVRLMDLARQGKVVERAPRAILIKSLDVTYLSPSTYRIDVRCSKGTYIRTLCADIGKKLGCGAVMSELRRAETGGFLLKDAISLETLEQMSEQERVKLLHLPEETIFSNLPAFTPPDFFAGLLYRGLAVELHKLPGAPTTPGARVRLCDKNGFFGIGVVMSKEAFVSSLKPDTTAPLPNGSILRCEKWFRLDTPEKE